jgi:uncharacterized protein YndB with AHSA1/START domain
MKARTRSAVVASVVGAASAEIVLIRLGRTYGSTPEERARPIAGDDIVANPVAVTNHAITIDAPPEQVWPWVVQMGWGRAGWYTARWVDRLLFPRNGPSEEAIVELLQTLSVGDFVPDGPPETKTGFIVEQMNPNRALVLHSTSHLPARWRARNRAILDWSWAFVLTPADGGRRTRYLFRSRWTSTPWWLSLGGWLGIVPADFIMSRQHLLGMKRRVERVDASARSEGEPITERERSSTMKRIVVTAEVDIERSPEDVFDYCSDLRHEPEWNPMMRRSDKLTDGAIGVGTRYATEFVKAPSMVMECVRYERPTTWSMVGQSKALTAGGGGHVKPTPYGAHLVMRMELEPRGPLKLAAPLIRRRMQPMFQRDLYNIKDRLEDNGTASPMPRTSRR